MVERVDWIGDVTGRETSFMVVIVIQVQGSQDLNHAAVVEMEGENHFKRY